MNRKHEAGERWREVFRRRDSEDRNPTPSAERLASIRAMIMRDLQPVIPLPSAPALVVRLLVLASWLPVVSGGFLGARGWRALATEERIGLFAPLALSASLVALAVVRQMSPTFRPGWPAIAWALMPFGLCGAVITAVFGPHMNSRSLGLGVRCASIGVVQIAIAAITLWLVVRRGAHLSQMLSGTSLGLLAGMSAMAAGQLRCPNPDRLHVMLAHASLPLIGAVGGVLAAGIAEWQESSRLLPSRP